jgi:hypothetical protein
MTGGVLILGQSVHIRPPSLVVYIEESELMTWCLLFGDCVSLFPCVSLHSSLSSDGAKIIFSKTPPPYIGYKLQNIRGSLL